MFVRRSSVTAILSNFFNIQGTGPKSKQWHMKLGRPKIFDTFSVLFVHCNIKLRILKTVLLILFQY